MTKYVEQVVQACHLCQLFKHPKVPQQPITMIERNGKPFSQISIDLSGPFPESEWGWTTILVVICNICKFVHLFGLKKAPATEIARILCDEIFAK